MKKINLLLTLLSVLGLHGQTSGQWQLLAKPENPCAVPIAAKG
jgi:hypothetical protein